MSARSFRPVMSVAGIAVAALSCYLVSLRVASERAGLEEVENKIVLAQRDIRTLQTEIGTRGRLEQLERWNVKVLALSAPKADQFVDGGYQLARLARPSDEVDMTAPVVLAAAPRPAPAQPIADNDADVAATDQAPLPRGTQRNDSAASMMHVASYNPSTSSVVPEKSSRASMNVSATTNPVKIATVSKRALLHSAKHDATAAANLAATKATKDKATN